MSYLFTLKYIFNKRRHSRYHGMLAWAFLDYLPLQEQYDCPGDHAAAWETSHLMAIHPETVDLSTLPPKGRELVGIMGKIPPQDATAEFGAETLEKAVDIAVKEAHHRLNNRQLYSGHGCSLKEGLWKKQ